MTMHPAQTEDSLHRSVADYLVIALPADVLWWHTPNGERRDKHTAARLKAMGVRAGIPDLLFAWTHRFGWIELKLPGEPPSRPQLDIHARLLQFGHDGCVCSSGAMVERALRGWDIPLRARFA